MCVRQFADVARANVGLDKALHTPPLAVELDHSGRGNALAVTRGSLH